MEQQTVTGMILSAQPIGEYDKRVVILTKEHGKISAFARGARRAHSPLLAATNPFVYGRFGVYAGRDSYTLTTAEVGNYFPFFATHLEEAYLGFYFLEYAAYYTHENNDEYEMLKLLYYSLSALSKDQHTPEMVRHIFQWRALVLAGVHPEVGACIHCGKTQGSFRFVSEKRGVVCSECLPNEPGINLSKAAIYTLRFVQSAPVKELFGFRLSPEVEEEFFAVVDAYYEKFHNRPFASLKMWMDLTNI